MLITELLATAYCWFPMAESGKNRTLFVNSIFLFRILSRSIENAFLEVISPSKIMLSFELLN